MGELRPDGTLNVWRVVAERWRAASPINPRRDPEVERRWLEERDRYFAALEEAEKEEGSDGDEQNEGGHTAARPGTGN